MHPYSGGDEFNASRGSRPVFARANGDSFTRRCLRLHFFIGFVIVFVVVVVVVRFCCCLFVLFLL